MRFTPPSRAGCAGATLTLALGVVSAVHAQSTAISTAAPTSASAAPVAPEQPSTYRTPVALAYAIPAAVAWTSVGLMCIARDEAPLRLPLLWASVAAYSGTAYAPPVVHWVHGSTGRGFQSLGGNFFFGGSGAFLGMVVGSRLCGDCYSTDFRAEHEALLVGGMAGATLFQGLWAVYDVAVLAREDVPNRRGRLAASWTPTLTVQPGGWTIGAAGVIW